MCTDTGSKERQKEEVNAEEEKNQRVKGRWKEGVKEERAGSSSRSAPAAARPVQHRGQLPPLSRSELRAQSTGGGDRERTG